MDFIFRLILFVLLINWVASMHLINSRSESSKIRIFSAILAIAMSVAIGFIVI